MSGNYSTQTFEVIKFGLELRKRGKRVWFVDERLTTRLAKTYGKKDDDRFSAEAMLLEFIQNPNIAVELLERKVENCDVVEFEKKRGCGIIEVPLTESLKCAGSGGGVGGEGPNGEEIGGGRIGYSRDPFVAYSLHRFGFFVYRVWDDFTEVLREKIEQGQIEFVLANIDMFDQVDALGLDVPVLYCKVFTES